MPSPFPGMDPYLEQPAFWSSFHFRFIGAIAAAIEVQLSRQYYVEVETRTYRSSDTENLLIGIPDAAVVAKSVSEPLMTPPLEIESSVTTQVRPQRVTLPMSVEVNERYLEVREIGTDAVITVIEVLSPKNKRAGKGRDAYEKKRGMMLTSATHLSEIDLLWGGKAMPVLGLQSSTAYRILVSRSDQRPAADLYTLSLLQPLPAIPVPLKSGDTDLVVDLQALLNQVYEEARYAIRIDYSTSLPAPLLSADEQAWIESLRVGTP
ncbi:MAG: DUF4058 family protein [Cyanobacteria bacterium P01_F01_bin.86]